MADETPDVTDAPVIDAPVDVIADTVERPTCCLTNGTCVYCKDNYCQGCGKNTTPLDA